MSGPRFDTSDEDTAQATIAVVGLAGRFAGSPDVRTLWENLRSGKECIERYTDEVLRERGVAPRLLEHPRYVKAGASLEGIADFDAGFFGFGPKDAAILDPQLRHFLEICWTALECAGHVPSRFDGTVGVFAGCGMNAYFIRNILSNPELVESTGLFLLRHTGNDRDFLSTTVSYKLNLTGPSMAVQTACSTSLVAVHFACQSLLGGECDMALAGGVTIDHELTRGYLYRENEVLAPDGHCRAFDDKAAGTVLSNGAGVVVLRRLADALEDGDYIHGVIRGSAVNNDGSRKMGYLAPSVDGQAAVVAEALAVAGVSADDISYVETHGTGTLVGDPIEVAALTAAFRQSSERRQFCAIGSNKPNIGHTDTAAGIASLIKVVEALKHREQPPSIHYERPNPNIDFENSPFLVNAALRPWEVAEDRPRIAGISSLGVGGTNAHVVVQEAPARPMSVPSGHCEVLPLSAKTASALERATEQLVEYLEGEGRGAELSDVAHTLQLGREDFAHRRAVAARTAEEAAGLLRGKDNRRIASARAHDTVPPVAFMFPGGGAQYPNMGRALYEAEKVYRDAVDTCLALVQPHLNLDLRALMYPGSGEIEPGEPALGDAEPGAREDVARRLARPSACLPAIFVTNHAAATLWMSWGIDPVALTGHSLGEYNAACLAGVMSLEDALRLVALRGRLVDSMYDQQAGAMLSIALPEAEVRSLIGSDYDLAASNAPSLCVVSGTVDGISALHARLQAREVECRRLRIPAAGHSRMLDPILEQFRQCVSNVALQAPRRPYITNLTGTWATPEQACDPEHWVQHLRRPVLFSRGLGTLLAQADSVLLEVGPGQTLSALARQQAPRPVAVVGSLPHPEDDTPSDRCLYTSLGRLWASGVHVDWQALRAPYERRMRLPLPTYAFDHKRYWIEAGTASSKAEAQEPTLRYLSSVDDWFYRRTWRPVGVTAAPTRDKQAWLVFLDSVGLGAALVRHLEANGHRVVSVREGDAFYRFSDREYALAPEAGPEGYVSLVKELAVSGALPDAIAHCWLVTGDERARPGSSFLHRNEEQGFYSVLFLAQALAAEDVRKPIRLCVLSSGMQAVGDEFVRYPEKAAVLGPIRVIPTELDNITCQSVDVALPVARRGAAPHAQGLERIAERVLRETAVAQPPPVVAYRDEQRFEEVLEPVPQSDRIPSTPRLKQRGTYLVTGGFGGIGLLVARHLAEHYQAKLVLVGRTPLPLRAEWDTWIAMHGSTDPTSQRLRTLLAMECCGAEMMCESADVSDLVGMERVLARAKSRFGKLDGVFHGAGALGDGPIQNKTQASMEPVLSPKLYGTMVLDRLLSSQPPDFLVLFSSTSTVLGPAGQADYVAANCFLNAFARSRAGERCHILAINWGVWRDVGAASAAYQRVGGREEAGRPVAHPLIDRRLADEGRGVAVFATDWTVRGHWVLDDHRTRERTALLPGTGYLALVHGAISELSSFDVLEIRSTQFVAPLQVGDEDTVEMRLRLQPAASGYTFEVESRVHGATEWQLHAQGGVVPGERQPPPQLDCAAIMDRCGAEESAREGDRLTTSQEAHLCFGSHWRCVQSMRFGEGEAYATLALLPEHRDDVDSYPLHPALLDMATGFATRLIPGYTGSHLYAPIAYERVRVYGRLPATVTSYVRSAPDNQADKQVAHFDVVVADEGGNVLVEVERFTVRRLEDATSLAKLRESSGRGVRVESFGSQRATAAERLFQEAYEKGIRPANGMKALEAALAGSFHELIVSSIDLETLVHGYRATRHVETRDPMHFERPDLATSYIEPRDDVDGKLAEIWSDLLGVGHVGIQDDFFELGGHSLIAVRLFSRIKKTWNVEYSLSVLFEAPTIERLADMLRADLGLEVGQTSGDFKRQRPRYRFLVNLQQGDAKRAPFFIVSGMFGNVLNLRHLATHLGSDQPVWALQARGLLGDDEPHESFEEAARDYLEELRTVQPGGPYCLGGFSGGGITAFEMAQQLQAQGECVAALVLLDSIPAEMPQMDTIDRAMWHVRKLQRQGLAYVHHWVRAKGRWTLEQWRARTTKSPMRDYTPAEFRSDNIEKAFRRLLTRYHTQVYPGRVTLFRPSHDNAYNLGRGRMVNEDRHFIDHDNRWGRYVSGGVDVHVVTGDHDSMVLEPHVRSMASKLREVLEDAREAQQSKGAEERDGAVEVRANGPGAKAGVLLQT